MSQRIKDFEFVKRIIAIILFFLIFLNVGSAMWGNKEQYFSSDFWKRYPQLHKSYVDSQYANKKATEWIRDEVVNAYAGGAYIKGVSPVLIAADTPPLGRYLIGLSALIFNNENIVTFVFAVLSLVGLYILGTQIFSSKIIALIPVALFSFEPIFKNQLIYTPLLDIIQLAFLLFSFYFFNKGMVSKKRTWLLFTAANIFLGLFISTKFFITGITIIAAWYLILLLKKDKKRLIQLTSFLPFSVIVLLLNYVRVFAYGYSFQEFLGIQKWVFLYHKSQLILPFTIWPLILVNKWYVWWGNKPVISDSQWLFTWPIITILSFITIIIYLKNKIPRKSEIEVLMIWIVLYFLFFSFGQISSRYFVILIPILYIVSIYGIKGLIIDRKVRSIFK